MNKDKSLESIQWVKSKQSVFISIPSTPFIPESFPLNFSHYLIRHSRHNFLRLEILNKLLMQ